MSEKEQPVTIGQITMFTGGAGKELAVAELGGRRGRNRKTFLSSQEVVYEKGFTLHHSMGTGWRLYGDRFQLNTRKDFQIIPCLKSESGWMTSKDSMAIFTETRGKGS